MQKGYLKDSPGTCAKGFTANREKILSDVMKASRSRIQCTESQIHGSGSLVLDTTKKYEPGDDIS